jgi:hypothetical protein
MILATRSFAKTFSCVGKPGWCFYSNLFYGNGGAKFRKEEWQRIGDQNTLPLSRSFAQAADASGFSRGLLPAGHCGSFARMISARMTNHKRCR